MWSPKQLFQIRLTTALLLMTVFALVVIVVTNGLKSQSQVDELENKVEMYEEHLPEYDIARQIEQLEADLIATRKTNGDSNPLVRKMEIELLSLIHI